MWTSLRHHVCRRTRHVDSHALFHAGRVQCKAMAFKFPAMSPTMTEGNIVKWKLKEGDPFVPGDVLMEIETDKATMEVEASDEGILYKIIHGDGAAGVKVNSTVAYLAEPGDDLATLSMPAEEVPAQREAPPPVSSTPPPLEQSTTQQSVPETRSANVNHTLLPSVQHLVHLYSLKDAATSIRGTGPKGRLLKGDVMAHIATQGLEKPKKTPLPPVASAASPSPPSTPITSVSLPFTFQLPTKEQLPAFLDHLLQTLRPLYTARPVFVADNKGTYWRPLGGSAKGVTADRLPKNAFCIALSAQTMPSKSADVIIDVALPKPVPAFRPSTVSFKPQLHQTTRAVSQNEVDFDYLLGARPQPMPRWNERLMPTLYQFNARVLFQRDQLPQKELSALLKKALQRS